MTFFLMHVADRAAKTATVALQSFLSHTPFGPSDRFVVVDRTGAVELPGRRTDWVNGAAPGLAGNLNQALRLAAAGAADLVFLSGEVTVTPEWWRGLLGRDNAISMPRMTAPAPVATGGAVPTDLYSCFRLPRRVYEAVGPFDASLPETEATADYRLRAALAGFDTIVAENSVVLASGRPGDFSNGDRFRAKWGDDIAELFLPNGHAAKVLKRFGRQSPPSGQDLIRLLNDCLAHRQSNAGSAGPAARDYLDLMERCLLNLIYEDAPMDYWSKGQFQAAQRARGRDWPSQAHTMIGKMRLSNFRMAIETALRNGVPGDIIETGVWRGGACIMARAVLKAYGVSDRMVWVADSFAGLPVPDETRYPADAGDAHHTFKQLAVSLDQVQDNFRKYGLLDGQVRFLKGWFKDTLPGAPIERLCVLRLDGDMYESTMDALTALYDKVQPGGYVIVDDYNIPNCRAAIADFRAQRAIVDQIFDIDGYGVYWQKGPPARN